MYKRISVAILVVATCVTAFFAYRTFLIGFDYNFESFFPRNDPDTDFFMEHRKKFGSDNDFILVGLKNEAGIFKYDFLQKVQKLNDSLLKVNMVEHIVSPTTIKNIIRDPLLGSVTEVPYIHIDNPDTYPIDSAQVFKTPELMGNLISADGKSLCLIINHKQLVGDEECQFLTDEIGKISQSFGFDEAHIAGRCVGQSFYVDVLKGELVIFLIAAFALIVLVIFLIYRSFWGVVIPLLIVGLDVIWTVGFMEVTGKKLDVLGNVIPTILVVVGLSIAIHVMTKFLDKIAEGYDKEQAIRYAIKQVGLATLFTTLTTFVGFATLATTGIKPIDDFGIYSAIGVAFSFFISYTVLPAILYLAPTPKKIRKIAPKASWDNMLQATFLLLIRYKKTVLWSFIAVGILSFGATLLIKENTYLLEDLGDDTKLKQDFLYFGNTFQGTRPFEMAIQVKDTSKTLLDAEVLADLEKMESYLKREYGLGFILSPVAIVKNANKALAGGDMSGYEIPSEGKLKRISRELKLVKNNEMIAAVFTPDFKSGRMRSVLKDIGSHAADLQNEKFYAFMNTELSNAAFTYKLTGTAELIDKNNRNLALNIGQGLIIAFVLITIIFLFMFKSLKMVIIGMIPNMLPLLLISGVMGATGISLKISTAILFTIAFGIAVDDTIHFLSKLRLEMAEQKSFLYAVKRTYMATGKPIIITSLLLCCGFMILGLSSFQATKMIGLLLSLILFFAVICDMLLLPVLLVIFYGKEGQEKASEKKELSMDTSKI